MAEPVEKHPNRFTRLISPEFFSTEAASGLLLVLAGVLALIIANSSVGNAFSQFWEMKLGFSLGTASLSKTLLAWLDDGVMAVFFLLVGLEIKREILVGELRFPRKALFPILGALGGMAIPAIIYASFNWNLASSHGWAIPVATDIAFSLGMLALVGDGLPQSVRVFLAALAIVDDLGAVVVIAIFYSTSLNWVMAAAALGVLILLILMNIWGVRQLSWYVLVGAVLWFFVSASGLHATIAGVLLAMTIPARLRLQPDEFSDRLGSALDRFNEGGIQVARGSVILLDESRINALSHIDVAVKHLQMPLQRMIDGLHVAVSFVIVPIFVLANAGIRFDASLRDHLAAPIFCGVFFGLVLGKPLGILGITTFSSKLGWCEPLQDIPKQTFLGVCSLAGIGLTMSLFLTHLAFSDVWMEESAKAAILAGSVASALIGSLLVRISRSRNSAQA